MKKNEVNQIILKALQRYIKGQEMTIRMTRLEIISRRYEAMKMKWPEKIMDFINQEMLILGAPFPARKTPTGPLAVVLNKAYAEYLRTK